MFVSFYAETNQLKRSQGDQDDIWTPSVTSLSSTMAILYTFNMFHEQFIIFGQG